jgi:hypothetical protein
VTRAATTPTTAPRPVDEHAAPADLTVPRAHELVQVHLRCATGACAARRAALDVLVAAGR